MRSAAQPPPTASAIRRLALEAGAATYVEKGASLEEVVTALRAALSDGATPALYESV